MPAPEGPGRRSRAANREGHFRKRPNGTVEFSIMRNGQRMYFYGRSQAEALRKADQAKTEARYQAARGETVAGWAETWLTDVVNGSELKPRTQAKYADDLRLNVLPYVGNIRLDALTTQHVSAMQAKLKAEGKGARTVLNARRVLGTALEAAIAAGKLGANPTRSRALRIRTPEKIGHVLTKQETDLLLRTAKGTRYEPLFVLAVTMGMRQGELLALRWRDIDFARGALSVRGTVSETSDGSLEIVAPKTRRSTRTLLLPAIAIDALRAAPHHNHDIVFPAVRGGLMRGTTILHAFKGLLKAAELPTMKFHDLRDTAATHMLEDGVSIKVVSEVLGHADEQITLQRYAHVTRGMQQAAVEAMNRRYA